MRIIYVNGVETSGKDTFVNVVKEYFPEGDVIIASMVDKVKGIAVSNFGWDGVKDEKGRNLLSALQNAWTAYNAGPMVNMAKIIHAHEKEGVEVMFIMIREYDLMMTMQKAFGGETLLIRRFSVNPGPTEQAFLDMVPAEYKYDYTAYNSSSLDIFKWKAKEFVRNHLVD